MHSTYQNNNWGIGSYFMLLGFILSCSLLVWCSSFALSKLNDDQKTKLTQNNLQLVSDNRELREQLKKLDSQLTTTNTKLDKLNKCLTEVK